MPPSVMDARIALHVLKSWARERIELRQDVMLIDSDRGFVVLSPCPTKGEDGWRFSYGSWERDRADAKDDALREVDQALAIVVMDTGYRKP